MYMENLEGPKKAKWLSSMWATSETLFQSMKIARRAARDPPLEGLRTQDQLAIEEMRVTVQMMSEELAGLTPDVA